MKLTVKLVTDADGWPPFSTESIWCEAVGEYFRIRNIPFFVKNIALNDVIAVSLDENGLACDVEVVRKSGNSTVWIYASADFNSELEDVRKELARMRCQVEGEPIKGYFAVNVPSAVDLGEVEAIFAHSGPNLAVAYAADRQSEH